MMSVWGKGGTQYGNWRHLCGKNVMALPWVFTRKSGNGNNLYELTVGREQKCEETYGSSCHSHENGFNKNHSSCYQAPFHPILHKDPDTWTSDVKQMVTGDLTALWSGGCTTLFSSNQWTTWGQSPCTSFIPDFLCWELPSVLWRCGLGGRKGIRPVKTEWWGTGMVISLKRGANDLHMVQLMPLPPHHLLLQ